MDFKPEEHLIDLKGKKYLQVMWRLVWFRKEHPDWRIQFEILEHIWGEYAVCKCWIWNPEKDYIVSEGTGSESKKDFTDYLEKAETKALGRALAMLGYGTQFAPELDEEDRIVDSPVPKKTEPKAEQKAEPVVYKCSCCGKEIHQGKGEGRKLKGKLLCNDCYAKVSAVETQH